MSSLDSQILISQYIHDRIQILNQVDAEIRRIRHDMKGREAVVCGENCETLLRDIQFARDSADNRLFELYSRCRSQWTTPEMLVACESAWSQLFDSWRRFAGSCQERVSGTALQIMDLISHLGRDSSNSPQTDRHTEE